MKRYHHVLFLCLILTLLFGVTPVKYSQAEEVVRATLKNGLRVIIIRNPLAPVATTVLNYLVGSNEAPAGFPGMAHAQEHMMFRGSPGLTADQLAHIMAEMGGEFDADTQQNVTQYFFTVPAEDLDVALQIQAIRMKDVFDDEDLWNKERGAINQEVAQDLSNPEYLFYSKLLSHIFAGTPYEHDALGTRQSFDKTTGEMLRKFHRDWYAPNNAVLVVCGDIDASDTLTRVEDLFGRIPAKRLPPRPEVNLQPVEAKVINLKTDRPYGIVSIAFRMPGYESPDYAASQVLADILNSHRGKLYSLVAEGKALFTEFEIDTLPKAGLGYVVAAFPPGADSKVLMSDVKSAMMEIAKKGVTEDLLAAAKLSEETDAEFNKNSISGLAMLWSQAVAVEGRQSPDDDIKAVREVTIKDVNRAAAKYLDFEHSVTALLTPEVSGNPVSSRGFRGKESFSPGKPVPVKLPDWAEERLGKAVVPRSSLQPIVSTLGNGLRLIIQPTNISNTVSVYGHIKNNPDMQTPSGKEGVNTILDRLFSYGTKKRDRLAFQKALDEIGALEAAGTDFSLKVLSGSFERGIQLLAENELQPALPPEAFKVVRAQTAAAVKGELKSPGFLSEQALKKGLFPISDPSLRHATAVTVEGLTLDDVRAYYSSVFRPDMTTIVVIGKVSPQTARAVIEKYFGSWKAHGPKPETDLPSVPDNRHAFVNVPDASRVQDMVTMAHTIKLKRTDPDYYALELGDRILGGAFYATKLYIDLRENSGLVYYVDSHLESGMHRSVYSVTFACDPDKVSGAAAIVRRDLMEMLSNPVSGDQLAQTRSMLLRGIPLSEASVDRIARGFIYRVTHDLPLDEPLLAAKRYLLLTAQDIREAFRRWIRPDDMVQVVRGPVPQ